MPGLAGATDDWEDAGLNSVVVLDLTSEQDVRYAVLVNALADYAITLERQADDERDREPGSYAETGFRQDAATARTLMAEIEQQQLAS